MKEVIPTVVPTTFSDILQTVNRYSAFAHEIHIDCADGMFAPNQTWLPDGEQLPQVGNIAYEAHLMVADPLSHGVAIARAGANRIIGHIEAFHGTSAVQASFDAWKTAGAREVGLAVLLETPLERIAPFIESIDTLLMMTIASIGVQGIPFDSRSIARVEEAHRMFPHLLISVDGGLNAENIRILAAAGAQRFSVGSALFHAEDPARAYHELLFS